MGTILKVGAFVFAFSFLLKIILHIYIDYSNGRRVYLGPNEFLPIGYFLPYYSEVDKQYQKWKWVCNFLYKLSIVTIIAIAIVALLRKFLTP
jgi:hypothetical protein